MQRLLLTAVLLLFPLSETSNALHKMERFNYEAQIGVVERFENRFCLTIRNENLVEGHHIQIITLNKPQSLPTALILKKLTGSCSTNLETDNNDSFYSLKLARGKVELNTVAIAVVNYPGKFVSKERAVSADLNKDGRSEYFRKCTSNEGIHLTVWSGKPLVGKRGFHRYFYLHYDVVPSCKEKDFLMSVCNKVQFDDGTVWNAGHAVK